MGRSSAANSGCDNYFATLLCGFWVEQTNNDFFILKQYLKIPYLYARVGMIFDIISLRSVLALHQA